MSIPSMNINNGCRCDKSLAPLFQYYIQSAQSVAGTKVQVTCMTVNTILMTHQPTGALYTDT